MNTSSTTGVVPSATGRPRARQNGGAQAVSPARSGQSQARLPGSRGRKEKQLNGSDAVINFALKLRQARHDAGSPTYRDMAPTAHYSPPALSQAANGHKLPTWPLTAAYLHACGITDLTAWQNEWHIAHLSVQLTAATAVSSITRVGTSAPHTHRGYEGCDNDTALSTSEAEVQQPRPLLGLLAEFAHRKGLTAAAIAARTRKVSLEGTHSAHVIPVATVRAVLSGRTPVTSQFLSAFLDAIAATPEERRAVGHAIGVWPPAEAIAASRLTSPLGNRQQHQLAAHTDTPKTPATPAPTSPTPPMRRAGSALAVRPCGPVRDTSTTGSWTRRPLESPTLSVRHVAGRPRSQAPRVRSHRTATGFHGQPTPKAHQMPRRMRHTIALCAPVAGITVMAFPLGDAVEAMVRGMPTSVLPTVTAAGLVSAMALLAATIFLLIHILRLHGRSFAIQQQPSEPFSQRSNQAAPRIEPTCPPPRHGRNASLNVDALAVTNRPGSLQAQRLTGRWSVRNCPPRYDRPPTAAYHN